VSQPVSLLADGEWGEAAEAPFGMAGAAARLIVGAVGWLHAVASLAEGGAALSAKADVGANVGYAGNSLAHERGDQRACSRNRNSANVRKGILGPEAGKFTQSNAFRDDSQTSFLGQRLDHRGEHHLTHCADRAFHTG